VRMTEARRGGEIVLGDQGESITAANRLNTSGA